MRERVRDVAWAASPDFQWDASGWDGILAQAYYRASARGTWEDAAKMSRYSILEYSTHWFRYPYPQISAVEGPVSGMEYPMVAMEARSDDGTELYNVITHEIGHMWYPMTVGSDERRYAWMDEGFNTFINTFSEEHYWTRDDSQTRRNEIHFVTGLDQAPSAQPIMTPANRYRNNENLGALAYVKPSIMLLALRNKVLGPEVFDTAFREYTRRWAFKHPQPADFFRTIEEVSGRDLAWFWRGFFFTTRRARPERGGRGAGARRVDPGDAPEPRLRGHAGRARARLCRRHVGHRSSFRWRSGMGAIATSTGSRRGRPS